MRSSKRFAPEKIPLEVPRQKRRAGVMPTRREVDRSKVIPRKQKHKEES